MSGSFSCRTMNAIFCLGAFLGTGCADGTVPREKCRDVWQRSEVRENVGSNVIAIEVTQNQNIKIIEYRIVSGWSGPLPTAEWLKIVLSAVGQRPSKSLHVLLIKGDERPLSVLFEKSNRRLSKISPPGNLTNKLCYYKTKAGCLVHLTKSSVYDPFWNLESPKIMGKLGVNPVGVGIDRDSSHWIACSYKEKARKSSLDDISRACVVVFGKMFLNEGDI